jgi:hypothetical protein
MSGSVRGHGDFELPNTLRTAEFNDTSRLLPPSPGAKAPGLFLFAGSYER